VLRTLLNKCRFKIQILGKHAKTNYYGVKCNCDASFRNTAAKIKVFCPSHVASNGYMKTVSYNYKK